MGTTAIIALGIFVFVFNSGQYRNAQEYHQHNSQALTIAATTTKQEASEIVFDGNKIADGGRDLGCTIDPITDIGSRSHDVNCVYKYDVFFLGAGNLPKEVGSLYQKIKQAGWNTTGGDGDQINLDKNDLYIGPPSVSFKKADSLTFSNYLDLQVIDSKSIRFADIDPLYKKLATQYVTNTTSFIFGFTIQYVYLQTTCTECETSNTSNF